MESILKGIANILETIFIFVKDPVNKSKVRTTKIKE